MRVLLLEDDELLGPSLQAFLRHEGHVVDWCRRLVQAEALKREPFDAFVVGWTLPDGTGLGWVESLRARGFTVPIIMTKAIDRLEDRVMALDAGADDCLFEPFHARERFFSKADLAALAIGDDSAIGSNALEVHVSSLRRKLAGC